MIETTTRRTTALLAGLAVAASVTTCVAVPHHRASTMSPPVTLSATVLAMGGLGYEDVDPALIRRALGGYFADADSVVGLPWPGQMAPWNGTLTLGQSVAVGLENMDAAIRSTPGQKVVVGASGTTLVVDEEMRRLANDPTAPPADELSFVVMGDANRGAFKYFRGVKLPIFDYTVPQIPVTKYNVLVVKGEYDGIGDWPDRWWNVLADLNALAGTGLLQQIIPEDIVNKYALEEWGSVHYEAMFADLSQVPAKNITVAQNEKGGITTTYLVPTADLPLLRPLKKLGVSQGTIDSLTKVLRPIIDSAYYRNDPPSVGTSPVATRVSGASLAAARPRAAAVKKPPTSSGSAVAKANAAGTGKSGAKHVAHSARSAG